MCRMFFLLSAAQFSMSPVVATLQADHFEPLQMLTTAVEQVQGTMLCTQLSRYIWFHTMQGLSHV